MTDEEWKKAMAACEATEEGHSWRLMSADEAYPASCGVVCTVCDTYELGWLGHKPGVNPFKENPA